MSPMCNSPVFPHGTPFPGIRLDLLPRLNVSLVPSEDAAGHHLDQPAGPHPCGLPAGLQLSGRWPRGAARRQRLGVACRPGSQRCHRSPGHPPGWDPHEDASQEPGLLHGERKMNCGVQESEFQSSLNAHWSSPSDFCTFKMVEEIKAACWAAHSASLEAEHDSLEILCCYYLPTFFTDKVAHFPALLSFSNRGWLFWAWCAHTLMIYCLWYNVHQHRQTTTSGPFVAY